MGLDEMRERLDIDKAKRAQDAMDEEDRKAIRCKTLGKVREIANGEFELIGATEDDVENNPDLMTKFNRQITKERCAVNDNQLVGVAE